MCVAILTYPEGFGRYIAGQFTFRETLADFLANCSFTLANVSSHGCPPEMIAHWTGGTSGEFHPLLTLFCYFAVYYVLVAICVGLYLPAGIFVPCFVIGACGGRMIGEILIMWWPEGFRGLDGPQIYPGLYAVVAYGSALCLLCKNHVSTKSYRPLIYHENLDVSGAAAYTGAVTHSLSIAVIVCETTGQLCALLPVLVISIRKFYEFY
ncbi:unnamed protein product, partial [Cylicostephanus goldi]